MNGDNRIEAERRVLRIFERARDQGHGPPIRIPFVLIVRDAEGRSNQEIRFVDSDCVLDTMNQLDEIGKFIQQNDFDEVPRLHKWR